MTGNFVFLNRLSTMEWCQQFSIMKVLPKRFRGKVTNFIPCINLAKLIVKAGDSSVKGYILACPNQKMPKSFYSHVKKLDPYLIGCEEELPELEKLEDDNLTKFKNALVTGKIAKMVLFIKAMKKIEQHIKSTTGQLKIFIWGADTEFGAAFTRLCAREWKFVYTTGDDQSKLKNLAHSILYESGLAVRISSNLKRDIEDSDVLVLAKLSQEGFGFGFNKIGSPIVLDLLNTENLLIKGPEVEFEKTKLKVPFKWNFALVELVAMALEGQYEDGLNHGTFIDKYSKTKSLIQRYGFEISESSNNCIFMYP